MQDLMQRIFSAKSDRVASKACLWASGGYLLMGVLPVGTGMAASADSATTASSNPAGISRFTAFAAESEILWLTSESNWESEFSQSGRQFDPRIVEAATQVLMDKKPGMWASLQNLLFRH